MLRIVTIVAPAFALIAASADAQLTSDSLRAKLYPPTGYPNVLLAAPVPPLLAERISLYSWQAPISSGRKKSPGLAWFLSFLVPGGGQGYNGQWGKAAVFLAVAAVGFNMTVHSGGPLCNYLSSTGDDCARANTGLAILAVSSIASQIDAPITAVAINRRNGNPAPRASLRLVTLHF
jgi:hypothetical protein